MKIMLLILGLTACSPTLGQFEYRGPELKEPWAQVIVFEPNLSFRSSIAQGTALNRFDRWLDAVGYLHNPRTNMVQIHGLMCTGKPGLFPPNLCIEPKHTQPIAIEVQEWDRFDAICRWEWWSNTITECDR